MSAGAVKEMAKNKGGRPPKDGLRTNSGQLSRGRETPHMPVSLLRVMVHAGKIDGRWLDPTGRLTINGTLSQDQHDAARWFADLGERYRQAIKAPSLTTQAQDVSRVRGGSGDHEDIEGTRYVIALWGRVGGLLSVLEREVLVRTCCMGLEPESYTHRMSLRRGLEKVAEFREGKRK